MTAEQRTNQQSFLTEPHWGFRIFLLVGLLFVYLAGPDVESVSRATASQAKTSASELPSDTATADFQRRCQTPGVVRCYGFDSASDVLRHVMGAWDGSVRASVSTDVRASGGGSLRFEVPSNSPANTSGSFSIDFSDDLRTQFGEGEEFYVQWRQRFSPEFLRTDYKGGGGWKQIIIGEGDRPGHLANSCTQLEIVVQNSYQRGFPQMYHSCGGKDGQYEPLAFWDNRLGNIALQNAAGCSYENPSVPPCVGYTQDQWMTFQVHVRIGRWYKNDGNHREDSTVQLWVAAEGRSSKLAIDLGPKAGHGYDLANDNPAAKYGKVWLMPYHTDKDAGQVHAVAYTWYDELIVSRSRIPDPGR
jgi:hypothetical protein